jgi:hypothetical protein
MPSPATSVLIVASIAFGSCTGLFAAGSGSGDNDCMNGSAHVSDCGLSEAIPFPHADMRCDARSACLSRCFEDTSCDVLSRFAAGDVKDPEVMSLLACSAVCNHD